MDIDLARRLISSEAKPPLVVQVLKEIVDELVASKVDPNTVPLPEGYAAFLSECHFKTIQFLATRRMPGLVQLIDCRALAANFRFPPT